MTFKVLFLSLLIFICFSASAQTVDNVTAVVGDNGKVIITYDLLADPENQRFSAMVYSSHNGFSSPLQEVSGDVSTEYNLVPGAGKKIEWDASSELSAFNGELSFEIRAKVYSFIRISRPSGKSVRRGSNSTITWTGGLPAEKIKIELEKGGRVISTIATVNNSGSYQWSISKDMSKGDDYSLRFTTDADQITSSTFNINAKYPLILKVAAPLVVVGGAIVLLGGGSDSGPLPVPPEPN